MSRPLRVLYAGAWYHVMNRGRRGESTFRDDKDKSRFLDLLRESSGRFRFLPAAFCLMENHFHLLLQTLDPNLPACMKHVEGVYTQYFNFKYGCDGSLFRGRYKSILVSSDSYLVDVVKYIHLNPKKAGLEEHVGEYKWSSHRAYLSRARQWEWIERDKVLSMLARKPEDRRKAYIEFMKESEKDQILRFYSMKRIPAVLGQSEFVQWVKDRFSDAINARSLSNTGVFRPSIDDIVSAVGEAFEVSREQIFRSRHGISNEARSAAMALARKWTGDSSISIAEHFGAGWGSAVSMSSRRIEKLADKSGSLRRRMERAEKKLIKCQVKT